MTEELEAIKYLSSSLEKKSKIILEKDAEIAKYKERETEVVRMQAEMEKYKEMLLQRNNVNYDNLHMIFSNEYDDEDVKIIGRHITEFGELAYDHDYQLVTRQECNKVFAVYLAPFEKATDLTATVEAINKMIEEKRAEDEHTENWPMRRMVPEMKMMADTLQRLEKAVVSKEDSNISQKSYLEVMDKDILNKTRKLEQIKKYTGFLDNLCHRLSGNEMKNNDAEKCERDEKIIPEDDFLGIQKTSENDVEERTVKNVEDDDRYPFKRIESMETKRKHVLDFLDYLQAVPSGKSERTKLISKISNYLTDYTSFPVTEFPEDNKLERVQSEFSSQFNLENTIGTVHSQWISFNDCYWGYIVVEGSLIFQDCFSHKRNILRPFYDTLSEYWPKNAKLATELNVPDDLSDFFVQTKNREVFVKDRKVLQWWMNLTRQVENYSILLQNALNINKLHALYLEGIED